MSTTKEPWEMRLSEWIAAHPEAQQSGQKMAQVRRQWARSVTKARENTLLRRSVIADLDNYLEHGRRGIEKLLDRALFK